MSRELQPPALSLSLVKTELPAVIKNEAPESEIVEIGIDDILDSSESEEEIISDLKDIDIVYHPVCETSIKSEILESYHCESVETQVLEKAENSPFIKPENISQKNKTLDTSDENVTKDTGQSVVEIQGSREHSNTLSNLVTHEQLVLNSSKDLNGIGTTSRKAKHAIKTDFAQCYKTDGNTSWKEDKEKIEVIKAPVIPVETHEYTSLAKNKHVCNHCQLACNKLNNLKTHIRKMHREVTTMYQCPYCLYKSKWKQYIINQHIIQKHKDTKDIQWFQCNLCEMKFKLKCNLTHHMKIHLKHKQVQDGLYLVEKSYHCNNCGYKTDNHINLKRHNLVHLKPEKIEYFYCYHCSHKNKLKQELKRHIFRQHFKNIKQAKRYGCNTCDYKTYTSTELKLHKLKHLKPEDIQYFHCYHCSYKAKRKGFPNNLEDHCSTIHFVSRTKSVPENSSKSWIFQCTYCPTKFPEERLLKGHLQLHSSTKGIECPICTYRHNKAEILKHLSLHRTNGEDPFICPICDLKKHTKENMDDHLKVVHSRAIYQKHDSVCKNKTSNGFCQITIRGNVDAE